jgi:hypothetical protein
MLTLRYQVTASPLARRHEHRLGRKIAWDDFDRRRYPKAALALAYSALKGLATGEYGAITLFARLASALSLSGAPFDIVNACSSIPADEARHADLAIKMAARLAGCEPGEVAVTVDRDGLEQQWDRMPDLDLWMGELSAISETLAAALLRACRDHASDKTVRALFTSIVADEIHHARLGWYYLAWRAPAWSRAERQRVADHLGSVVAGVEEKFWRGRDSASAHRAAARALGVLDSKTQRATIRQVMEEEIVPGLDALGLGASHAWRKRRRGR